jgi:microcystin-dependent protein
LVAQPFLGEIRIFAGPYAPKGWAMCDGSAQRIAQNEALYDVIGTTYGGDGVETFNLPDLRGRVPVHMGSNGVTTYALGEALGSEHVALSPQQYPMHTHAAVVSTATGNQQGPGGNLLAASPGIAIYSDSTKPSDGAALNAGTVGPVIGGQEHGNLQPLLVITYIIALSGTFPVS